MEDANANGIHFVRVRAANQRAKGGKEKQINIEGREKR